MEAAVSAIVGELLSRFISFIIKKHEKRACRLEEKLEKLQLLLLRVHTVVEEAEARYITNSRMLKQLKMLVDGMYRGYYLLDTFKYRPDVQEIKSDQVQVTNTSFPSFASPVKRFRTTASTTYSMLDINDLEGVLGNLETIIANMAEFVILLAGCKHMYRRPYDIYLYIDNFMFGRVVEKQQIISILLQDNPLGAPTILPIIGGYLVGKKTLVGHACHDRRVLSHFSSILHLNEDDIRTKDHKLSTDVRTLVVVEFFSDVDDDCWAKFRSAATSMGRGSKVIIMSRLQNIARLGTVKPIRLNTLSHEEYVYLFKALAFGSTNPDDYPQLAYIGLEFARLLHGLLLSANVIADMLRKNLNVQYWLLILKRYRKVVESNFYEFGEHPKLLVDKGHPVDVTRFASPNVHTSLRLMPSRGERSIVQKERSKVTFRDLIAGSSCTTTLPKEEFEHNGLLPVW
ncbi:uncharacterized protein LOC133903235 [Phragmites australis]|uniref:uncharacterized protein LOC133903235 n=1 Tax=Phragmites australis TaxID=29695 RepID=UPI002D780CAD|nr:uncharacterized protein LOC133903235 [Phragmites australis]